MNVPLIDYTLEWLASAGVEECFVFCCAHANQVRNHLTKAKWRSQPNFTVTPIESHDCVSAGDALRLIEQRGVVSIMNFTVLVFYGSGILSLRYFYEVWTTILIWFGAQFLQHLVIVDGLSKLDGSSVLPE